MLLINIGDGLMTFTSIDQRWYLNMTDSSTAFFNAVNLAPKVDVFINVCLFDDQIVGIEPTKERIPVVDLTFNCSCP